MFWINKHFLKPHMQSDIFTGILEMKFVIGIFLSTGYMNIPYELNLVRKYKSTMCCKASFYSEL